jgi:ABC-type transporter Mla subunit MlaD
MNKFCAKYLGLIIVIVCLTSCEDISNQVDKKLDALDQKTKSLDSLVNKELDKVESLDSLIEKETNKVKKLDSLMEKSGSRLDSIVNRKMN